MRQIKEIQTIRDHRPIFILMLLALGLPALGMFIPLFTGEMSGSDEFVGFAIVVLVLGLTLFLLLKMKTEVRIMPDQVSYKFNPFINKSREIKLSEMSSWSIQNHKWIHGLGYKVTLGGGRVYVMSPGKVLTITTKDGKSFRFGINKPEAVQRFIAEHWDQKESTYG